MHFCAPFGPLSAPTVVACAISGVLAGQIIDAGTCAVMGGASADYGAGASAAFRS